MAEQPKSNILKALEGLPVTTNHQPKSRILQAIEDGGSGGGGGSYDDGELRRRIEALENQKPQTFIAIYQSTTAQEIIAFLDGNPHAALLVQNGVEFYTTIFSKKLADNKVLLRTIATLQSKFNIFEYTVTNSSWTAITTPLHYDDRGLQALVAENERNIKFISSAINRLHDNYLDYEPISSGVCFVDNAAKPIQTAYRMNGDYEFIVKGHTTTAGKGCLIGAYQANNARTTMQLLGESFKLQGQWSANRELTKEQAIASGLPENYLTTPQNYKINKDGVFIKQGEDWLQLVENSGYTGTGNFPVIYLLGDREIDHTAHYGVLYYAEILDADGNTAATFIPAKNKLTGEIVILQNNKTGSFVLRPVLGSLKEFVNEIQAA